MQRLLVISFVAVLLISLALGLATPTRAMPEYATQVGEPCASCHVSPAGGGMRNVRGQAWVTQGRPSTVPSTEDALKIMGVSLPSDMSIYTAAPAQPQPAAPFQPQMKSLAPLLERLLDYEGN